MKLYLLLFVLGCQQLYTHEPYRQRTSLYRPSYQDEHNDNECSSSFISAALLGAASGLLCREFEKRILQDLLPLRVINLIVWGSMQKNFIDAIIEDLHAHKIKHSPETIKQIAWLVSWMSYILDS